MFKITLVSSRKNRRNGLVTGIANCMLIRNFLSLDKNGTRHGYMSKKVGRNAPCPCGSGKKYKSAV